MAPAAALRRVPTSERVLAGLFALGSITVLALALSLRPSSEGHGTHTSLGLPPCTWAVAFDRPCPTCGMTTSFSHAAKGNLMTAMRTQPMGLLLVIGAATTFWTGAHVAASGARVWPALGLFNRRWAYLTLASTFLGAWIYKIITWGG